MRIWLLIQWIFWLWIPPQIEQSILHQQTNNTCPAKSVWSCWRQLKSVVLGDASSCKGGVFKQPLSAANPNRTRIDYYYLSRHCILCGELVQTLSNLCNQCLQNEAAATTAIIRKTSKLESEMQHLTAVSTIAILFRYIRFLGFFGYTNLLSTESDALVACCLIYSIGSVITKVLLTFISDSFFRKICKNHPYNITKRKM